MTKVQAAPRRIALFVEGDTERGEARQKTLSVFLHKWLDPHLPEKQKVGIHAIKFHGVSNYLDDLPQKLELHLAQRKANCVFGLIDLYGLPPDRFDFSKCNNVADRVRTARATIKRLVPPEFASRFRQHFSVHEVEAWLLAYPERFPPEVREMMVKRPPESVNLTEPPAKFLKRILGGRYKKTVVAKNVFPFVDPKTAVARCPYLSQFVNDLLLVAKAL